MTARRYPYPEMEREAGVCIMKEFVSTVTRKGQVTIPIAIRKHLGVGTPDKVSFVLDDDGQVELKPARLTLGALRGVVPPLPGRQATDFEDQIEEALQDEADRIVRALRSR